MNARMATCVHESAHALAAQHTGATDVRLWLNDGDRHAHRSGYKPWAAGQCCYATVSSDHQSDLFIALAGPEGERAYTGDRDRRFWLWNDCIAWQYERRRFMTIRDDPLFQGAYRMASDFVAAEWNEILSLARRLDREGFIHLN